VQQSACPELVPDDITWDLSRLRVPVLIGEEHEVLAPALNEVSTVLAAVGVGHRETAVRHLAVEELEDIVIDHARTPERDAT
jgi:hypothetical protein